MSTTRIPPAEITGLYGALVKRFSKKLFGRVPEPVGVYWHNRAVLKAAMTLGAKSQKWDACDLSLKSFAHMAVAAQIGCSWCLDFGYFQAFNEHLDLDKAHEVPRWRESAVFTPLERAVLGYAEAMTQTPPTVTDEMAAELLGQLGEPALVELTAFIAVANMNARSNVALGIESEGYADSCELKPMAAPGLPSMA
ncbi:MAG TPA: carboxymuconolactone decarboxylase family protein [Jatrophihabitans sp.]|nr:carboxymuconolactone decarboxylase family protein [Jatrophihabitans sp.]